MNYSSSHQRDERSSAPLCAAGCGFFGSAENQGFCSKCYKDYLKQNNTSRSEPSPIPNRNRPDLADQRQIHTSPAEPDIGNLLDVLKSETTAQIDSNNSSSGVSAPAVAKKNRCELCRKKVGLLGFECRCGGTFCGTHRYAEAHTCTFDFKQAGKSAIQKENPVVRADKITDRI